ncbi:MAG: DUF4132 domain-containing protein [Candidatus Obscuribacterales bacterium]|nr:DUF4132 domain-containing protein [Candidatus Obscuribacterales bacterium]
MAEETFQFNEGSSNKFWTILLEGSSFTVTFGKVGTAGQKQTKSFGSELEAQAAYNKLVAEKLKKGYVRTSASPATTASPTIASQTGAQNVVKLRPQQNTEVETESKSKDEKPTAVSKGKAATALAEEDKDKDLHELNASAAQKSAPNNVHETRFSLRPEDYIWCQWLPRTVNLRKPAVVPFDRDSCLQRLNAMTSDGYKWINAVRKKYPNPLQLSREEAEFWFRATEQFALSPGGSIGWDREKNLACQKSKERIFENLRGARFTGIVTTAEMDLLFKSLSQSTASTEMMEQELTYLICALCPAWDFVQYASGQRQTEAFNLMQKFREWVMPFLPDKDLEFIQNWLRPHLKPAEYLSAPVKSRVKSFYTVASFLRMGDEIQQLLEQLPDREFRDVTRYEVPHALIFALPSPESILQQAERLDLQLRDSPYIVISRADNQDHFMRYWMAATGTAGLDRLLQLAKDSYNKEEQEKRFKLLALAEAPELTPVVIELLRDSFVPHLARVWLEAHPRWSVPELLKLCSEKGKLADSAKEILGNLRHGLSSAGLSAEIVAQVNGMFHSPDDSAPIMDEASMPQWLKDAFAEHKPAKEKLPDWLALNAVPPIMINKQKLGPEYMEQVLFALKKSTFDVPHPLIQLLKNGLESRSSDKCAWWLFDKWLKSGAPPKDKWAMFATGLLGSDDTALKLTPLIRQWPGESQHQRAVVGLECLRQIGSDTALMQINGIAQKLPFKALKQKAAECMEHIARERGFSREELEDRIVPDCGLDERGQRVFDFGPRQFSFVLSGEMKALVKDEEGKVKPDLPKPNSKDDATKSESALLDWKLLKQQIKDVAKVQAFRLEQAMVTGRRWNVDDFQNLLVKHPLMFNLIRLMVWGEFDMEGMLRRSFRVTEDQTLADQDDKLLTLEGHEDIGIVHPLQMDENLKTRWGEVFSDYDLISPFPQLGRAIYTLDESEKSKEEITRFAGKMIPAASIVSILEKHGWQRGSVEDGGCFHEHYKFFPGANITAVASYDWIGIGMIVESDDQDIKSCHFEQASRDRSSWYSKPEMVPLEFVDSIVISEVLADLTLLASKARADY